MLTYPFYLVAKDPLPVANVQDLIAFGKANPGKLSYGSIGAGSGAHLVAEMFRSQAGFDALHVPYKGAAEFLQAVQTGQVDYVFDSPGSAQPTALARRARGLAVTSAQRWPTVPDMPTLDEAGLAGFESGLWLGVLAPAGTPNEVIDIRHQSIVDILKEPQMRARIEKSGFQVLSETPDEFQRRLVQDGRKWGEVIRRNRITVD